MGDLKLGFNNDHLVFVIKEIDNKIQTISETFLEFCILVLNVVVYEKRKYFYKSF